MMTEKGYNYWDVRKAYTCRKCTELFNYDEGEFDGEEFCCFACLEKEKSCPPLVVDEDKTEEFEEDCRKMKDSFEQRLKKIKEIDLKRDSL